MGWVATYIPAEIEIYEILGKLYSTHGGGCLIWQTSKSVGIISHFPVFPPTSSVKLLLICRQNEQRRVREGEIREGGWTDFLWKLLRVWGNKLLEQSTQGGGKNLKSIFLFKLSPPSWRFLVANDVRKKLYQPTSPSKYLALLLTFASHFLHNKSERRVWRWCSCGKKVEEAPCLF